MLKNRFYWKTTQLVILCLLLGPVIVHGRPLQILHTNDLHGFLENSMSYKEMGGYSAVKALLDEQRANASEKGIESLVLDAGDFLEGSIFYLAEKSRRVFNIMNLMGYDAVVLGNHDWLMGSSALQKLIKAVPPKFSLLSANLTVSNKFDQHLKNKILRNTLKPYVIINRGGYKVAILGLSTSDQFYSWCWDAGKAKSPIITGPLLAKEIKETHNPDIIIALTHMGVTADRKLVQRSEYIDLVVGGHSHTTLHAPLYELNKAGARVPIVQAGDHGRFIGKIILDEDREGRLTLREYEVLPVYNDEYHDPEVDEYVVGTREILNRQFGEEWLKQEIGDAKVPLVSSYTKPTVWTSVITDGIKEATNADISIHSPLMAAPHVFNPGPVTNELVFNTYPRVFSLDDSHGWYLWKVNLRGILIKFALKVFLKMDLPLQFSGVTFKLQRTRNSSGEWDQGKITDIRINGEKVKMYKKYSIALPEGIALGGQKVHRVVATMFKHMVRTEKTLWHAMISKVKSLGTIDLDYESDALYDVKADSQNPIHYTKRGMFVGRQ